MSADLRARLLDAVAALKPLAEARARDAERDATLHPDVVAAARAAGLFALAAPREVGGDEADVDTQLDVFEAAAHADASFGWCLMLGSLCSAMMGAYLPEAGARAAFAAGVPVAAGLQQPCGIARPTPEGYVVEGRWGFGSGARHADWFFTPAVVAGAPPDAETGMPQLVSVAVPASQVVVERTWDAAGMRGTGSDHYRLEGVAVDASFTCAFPRAAARRGGPRFRLPFVAFVAAGHVGFALGVARRALEEVAAIAPRKTRTWTQAPLAAHAPFRFDLGRVAASLDAARAFARDALGAAEARVHRGEHLDALDFGRVRAAVAHATDVAAATSTFAFRAGGASALDASSLLQRGFRDANAAALHAIATEDAYAHLGGALLGDAPAHPLFAPREALSAP